MQIVFVLFDRITALDAIGPYEVLSRLPDADVRFAGLVAGPYRTDRGIGLVADHALTDALRPDILVVPGGPGARAVNADPRLLDWLRRAHEGTRYTTSVCTGSLLLGAAGLLAGLEATTHWGYFEELAATGARPVSRRVVEQGKIITAAGVSAGIDMALTLAARIAGDDVARAIQLGIEYDPQPPFDSGSPSRAPAHVLAIARSRLSNRPTPAT